MRRFISKAATCALFLCCVAWAQLPAPIDPGAVDQHSTDASDYYKLENRIDRGRKQAPVDPLTNRLQPAPAASSNSHATFLLKKIEINPSQILTPKQLSAAVRAYEGKDVTLADLNTLVASLNQMYKSLGYITAMAALPPQKIEGGVVHIQLVEARLGALIVKDAHHTRASYFTNRLPIHPGALLRVQDVERILTAFNELNDVKVRAVLQPGRRFGTTDLVLEVQSPTFLSSGFSFDNAGLASTGHQRVGTNETISSLSGNRDPLGLGLYWSDGMWAGSGSYDFPLTADGLRLGTAVSYDNIQVHENALQKLAVTGTFYDVSLRLSHPFATRKHLLLTPYLAPHFQESTLQSKTYPISNIPVRSLEFGLDAQESDTHGFLTGNLSASGGDYDAVGFHSFVKFGGALTRVETLPHSFIGILRVQGQGKAADPSALPPSQQFQVGGVATVRGYSEGALIADEGYAATAELDTPVPLGNKRLLGFPLGQLFKTAWFIDQGAVLSGPKKTYLTGTGGGLIVNLSRYFEGRVYLATPLEHRSEFNSLAVHFAISANPSFAGMFKFWERSRILCQPVCLQQSPSEPSR